MVKQILHQVHNYKFGYMMGNIIYYNLKHNLINNFHMGVNYL